MATFGLFFGRDETMDDMTILKTNPSANCAIVGEEVIFLHEGEGAYFSLDGVGAFVWQALETPRQFGELVQMVMGDYEVEESVLREDLAKLASSLVAKDLLILESE